MKKLLLFAALVLGMASCQTEPEGLDVVVGGEQEVMLNVSLPESTRMASSAGFDFTNFDRNSQYDLRFILEIAHNGKVVRTVKTSNTTNVTFPVRLAPDRYYTFTVWADLVNEGSQDDRYYNILSQNKADDESVLNNITFNTNYWAPNVEARDAYTFTTTKEFKAGETNLTMNLTRPFAKVRVVATDIEDVRKFDIEPDNAVVTYNVDMYTSFNAVTGVASEAEATAFEYTINPEAYEEETGKLTVFADYIFVPEGGTVKFDLVINDGNAKIKENNFNTTIPVVANKVTSIVGDVLTLGGNVSITVNNGIDQNETINFVDSAESLIDAINAIEEDESANIKLGGDIDLGDLFGASILSTRAAATLPIVIAEGKTLVLDLNGFKITTPFVEGSDTNHTYAFENHGSLTIQDSKGNGQIIARGIFNYGTMTLVSGTINACDGNGGYGVRNYEGAEFVMDGGSIVTSYEDGDIPGNGYDASPVRVDEGATATFNGGTINNISNFTVAIDNYGETTINDGTFTTIHTTIANSATMTINGGSFTCNGLEGVTAHAFWAAAGTTTINGGTFDGKDNYNGFNICASKGATVNIKGGEFLSVHSGSLYGEGTITVYGGTFFDDPSARLAENYEAVKGEDNYWTVKMTEEAKLRKVLAEGGEITLQKDITIAAQLEVTTTEAIVVNGNGKTITYTGSTRAFNVNGLDSANVTLNNLTFVSEKYNERCINFNVDGALTLNNVTVGAKGTPATYAINLPGSSDGAEVVINNSNIRGLIALNIWGENVVVDATDTIFSNYDTTEVEDYTTIVLNNDGSTVAENSVVNIIGGKVISLKENGEPSYAVSNGTINGVVNISETTEVIGAIKETVAIVDYNSTSFYSYTTLQGAIDKVCKDKSGFVRLVKDITVDETITIPAKGNVTIDLNEKTITGTDSATSSFGLITNQGTLTVKNGTITLVAENDREWNAYSSVISNNPGGNLVVEDVTIEHLGGTSMAYGIDNLTNGKGTSAVVTVNDGAVVKSTYRAIRQFLNGVEATNELYVNAGAEIEGANKSIWMQDPSAKANTGKLVVNEGATLKGDVYLFVCAGSTEWPVEVSIAAAALAEGSQVLTGNVPTQYEVVEENGVWVVKSYDAVATDAETLTAAFAKGGNIIMAQDINSEAATTAPYGNKYGYKMDGGLLNGNGFELDIECYGDDYGIMTSGGTIKNLTIDNATRAVMIMYVKEDVVLDNVNFGGDGVLYPINTGEAGDASKTANLVVTNSTLAGWISYSNIASASFTNVKFMQGTYYNNIYGRVLKPYVNTSLTDCSFVEHMNLDLSGLTSGHKVTIKNCTVNGQAVTANVLTVPTSDSDYDTMLFSVDLPGWATSIADCVIFE